MMYLSTEIYITTHALSFELALLCLNFCMYLGAEKRRFTNSHLSRIDSVIFEFSVYIRLPQGVC